MTEMPPIYFQDMNGNPILNVEWPEVPRVGDSIILDDKSYDVHRVYWRSVNSQLLYIGIALRASA